MRYIYIYIDISDMSFVQNMEDRHGKLCSEAITHCVETGPEDAHPTRSTHSSLPGSNHRFEESRLEAKSKGQVFVGVKLWIS